MVEDPGAPLGVTINGLPVDCTRTTTVSSDTAAVVVAVAAPTGTAWTATLDGVDVRPQFVEGEPHRADLTLAADAASILTVERAGDFPFRCDATLVFRPAATTAAEALDTVSAGGATFTYSMETGGINGAVLDVPTEGSTPSERGAAFLATHAQAFGTTAANLREVDLIEAPDGWVTLYYEQVFGEVVAFEASLELELDAEGHARSVHARLYPPLESAPSFVLDASQALAIAADAVGTATTFLRVVYEPSAPRPGWWVTGELGSAIVDDSEAELQFSEPLIYDTPLSIQRPSPAVPHPFRLPWARRTVASGDTNGSVPASLGGPDRQVFATISTISRRVEGLTGGGSWRGGSATVVTDDMVREGTAPDGSRRPGAFYVPGQSVMYLDANARERLETICHEAGHAYDDARGGSWARTFAEMYGDVFYLFCEPWVNPGGVAYSYNDSSRRHDGSFGRPDQVNYDEFLEMRIRERDIGRTGTRGAEIGTHDHAFLITVAFYAMMEDRGLDRDKAQFLAFNLASGSSATYPEVRDRILRDAVSWARSGRHGFTEDDVCAVAQGFRTTRLDGEYGRGAGCSQTNRTELVCTANHCPLCGDRSPPMVCRPETVAEGQPVCQTADGRRTCVGSIATSAEGCPSGASHLCWCVGRGSGAAWDCSTAGECVADPDARDYCPEDPGPAPGTMPMACSAHPARASALAGLVMGLAMLLCVGRRRL